MRAGEDLAIMRDLTHMHVGCEALVRIPAASNKNRQQASYLSSSALVSSPSRESSSFRNTPRIASA